MCCFSYILKQCLAFSRCSARFWLIAFFWSMVAFWRATCFLGLVVWGFFLWLSLHAIFTGAKCAFLISLYQNFQFYVSLSFLWLWVHAIFNLFCHWCIHYNQNFRFYVSLFFCGFKCMLFSTFSKDWSVSSRCWTLQPLPKSATGSSQD